MAIYTAPDGKTVDDPDFGKKILDNLAQVEKNHPNQILRSVGYFKRPDLLRNMADASKKHAFMSIQLKGNDDDTILNNYKAVQHDLAIPGVDVKLAGLQPLADELTGTVGEDQKRAEVLALPLVAVVLFFVFGGVVAASLPAMVGGLSIAGALGIMRLVAISGPVHFFAQPVVTLIGLGIAVDYGLFVVSRFREEIAEGHDTETAVRHTVTTAGRTVTFSAVLVVASAAALFLFPQGFLRSLTYAMIASVMLSAILSITVLPACLAILGRHVDSLGCVLIPAGAVLSQLETHQLVAALAGRAGAEDQDPRRGRERLLGQAGQPGDEAADRVRDPDCHHHDSADRPAGQTVPGWYQRKVPAADQLGAPGAGGVRPDLPRVPHRAAHAGDPEFQPPAGHRRSGRADPQQGDGHSGLHRPGQRPGQRCGRNAPTSTARRRIRRSG